MRNMDQYISGVRFDLAAKLIYASYRMRNLNTTWHIDLYKNHILTFNGGWEWPGGEKDTLNDFLTSFNNLIDNFDPKKAGVIPVSEDGYIVGGAHRTTVAYLKGIKLKCECKEKTRRPYDYRFFQNRLAFGIPSQTPNKKAILPKLESIYTDEMALEFCRRCPKLRMVLLFPIAQGNETKVAHLLSSKGDIIYVLRIQVSIQGLDNLIKECYRGEPWVGSDPLNRFFAPSTIHKSKRCWNASNPYVRVYLFSPSNTDLIELKRQIRDIYGVQNHSVHINDTHEETLRLAGLLFNQNSRYFLQNSKPLNRANQEMFKKYFDATKGQEENYCITGSFVLALYGLRESRDLDFIYSSPAKDLGGSHNPYESLFGTSLDDIIFNPRNHFYMAGRKVASLKVLQKMKRNRNEPKDQADVKLIDSLLNPPEDQPPIRPPYRSLIRVRPGSSFDIHQITFYKNGLRLENFYRHNKWTKGYVNFFEASDTTENIKQSIEEGLKTRVYNPNIPRFAAAITVHPGKIGCNLSHYYLYLHLLENSPCKWHLILEDDVEMTKDTEKLFETLHSLISEDTHYIKLITFEEFQAKQFLPKRRIKGSLYKKIADWGTGAQLISDEGLRILLDNRPWDFIDKTVNDLMGPLKCTCFKSNLFKHCGTESGAPVQKKQYGSLIYGVETEMTMKEQRIGFPSRKPPEGSLIKVKVPEEEVLSKVFENSTVIVEFGDSGILARTHRLYCISQSPFISRTWHLRRNLIPICSSSEKGIKIVKYLPFTPDAVYISSNIAPLTVQDIISTFGSILIVGKRDIGDIPPNSRLTDHHFIIQPKPIVIGYTGFWNGFDPEKSYLKRLVPRTQFTTDITKCDIIYQGDYRPPVSSRVPVIAYSAEVWFRDRHENTLTITLRNTGGKNLQLRNYERIYFERFGKTDVYSNLPMYRFFKRNFCCFVVKNPNCWQRNLFFDMLNKVKKVDALGSHKHNVDFKIPERDPYTKSYDDYLKILGRYRFCICFENTSQKEYMTEKLYNAMKSGSIPIYWGDPDCVRVYNPKSFLYIPTCKDRSEQIKEFEKAIQRIQYLEDNPEEYRVMLAQRRVLHIGKENHRVADVLETIKSKIIHLQ